MKKLGILLIGSLLCFSTISCTQNPEGEENPQKTQQEDTTEYLDLRNVLLGDKASRAAYSRAANYVGDAAYTVTTPLNKGDDKVVDEWILNQNPELYTDEVIAKLFKFEPAEDGVKVTYTRPSTITPTGLNSIYSVNIFLIGKNGHGAVLQDLSGVVSIDDETYTWVFPFTDPNNTNDDGTINLCGQVIYRDDAGVQYIVNRVYHAYCGGGLGRPADISVDLSKHSLVSNKVHKIKSTKLPEEENVQLRYFVNLLKIDDISEKGAWPNDENGNDLYKTIAWNYVSVDNPKKKFNFDWNLADIKHFTSVEEYPYMEVIFRPAYTKTGYKGVFSGEEIVSPVYKNIFASKKALDYKKLTDDKKSYLLELNEPIAYIPDYFVCFTLSKKASDAESWAGVEIIDLKPEEFLQDFWTKDAFKKTYAYSLAEVKKIRDENLIANGKDPTGTWYNILFNQFNDNGFGVDDIWFAEPVTITLETNGGTVAKKTVTLPKDVATENDLLPTPKYESGWFAGWYTDAACTVPFNGKASKDMTLYAKKSDKLSLLNKLYRPIPNDQKNHEILIENVKDYENYYICMRFTSTGSSGAWFLNKFDFDAESGERPFTKTVAVKISDILAERAENDGYTEKDQFFNFYYNEADYTIEDIWIGSEPVNE